MWKTFIGGIWYGAGKMKQKIQASFGMREWNGMRRNEKNNFKIFFHSLIWEYKWEGME